VQQVRVEDWLRVQRELLEAERAYSARLREYADGRISEAELRAAKEQLQAKRELGEAVTHHAFDLPARSADLSRAGSGETEGMES
jgi:hypothetical protein